MLELGSIHKSELQQLLECGILDDNLASFLWDDLIRDKLDREEQKRYLILVMERFDLLCERLRPKQMENEEPQPKSYYVPARLRPHKSNRSLKRMVGPSTVFFIDFIGFLPEGFFNRLLTRCGRWSQEQGGLEPKLHYHHAEFYADDDHEFELEMLSVTEACIKVTIFPSIDITELSHVRDIAYSLSVATNKVKLYLESAVDDLKNIWMKGITFRFIIDCPSSPTSQHFLDLNECLELSFVPCRSCDKRVDTKRIQQRFISSGHMDDETDLTKITCTIGQDGGSLFLPATGIRLYIPEGAIPTGESLEVTLSQPLAREPPPLDDNHVLVTPIVRCEPDGASFLKPAVLTLPCYSTKLSERDITIWTRSKSVDANDWVRLDKIQDSGNSSNRLISIGSDSVQLEMWHFSDNAADTDKPITLEVLVLQNPKALHDARHAFITVYAAPKKQMMMIKKRNKDCLQVALLKTIRFLPDKRDLKIYVSEVQPNDRWEPDNSKGEIPFQDIQSKEIHPSRQFRFVKKDGAEDETVITGALRISQDDSGPNGYYFSSDMLLSAQGQVAAAKKRKQQQPGATSTKRPREIQEIHIPGTSDTLESTHQTTPKMETDSVSSVGANVGGSQDRPVSSRKSDQGLQPEKLTIRHFNDIVNLLGRENRTKLYHHLRMPEGELEDASIGNDQTGISVQQARGIFNYWRNQRPNEATIAVILLALKRCKNNEKRLHFDDVWINKGDRGYTDKLEDTDITQLVNTLSPSELEDLYPQLNLEIDDIDKTTGGATAGAKLKALRILTAWRKRDPEKATTATIIEVLRSKLGLMKDTETLEKKWTC